MYYLQSRYYDPEVGRFLNADALTSTGQGLLGNNMFAYCGNNPVIGTDPNGESWLAITAVAFACALFLGGCSGPTSDVGAASEYVEMPGSSNPASPNCYAYAIGFPVNLQPGAISKRYPTDYSNVEDVGASVEADLLAYGYSVRRLSGPNDKLYSNEFKIALRVGTTPYGFDSITGKPKYDYHFMVQTATGQWAEKHGTSGSSILHPVGMTPDTIPWSLPGVSDSYYDSDTIIYFAVGK